MTDWTNDVLFGEMIMPSVQEAMENAGAAEWQVSLCLLYTSEVSGKSVRHNTALCFCNFKS